MVERVTTHNNNRVFAEETANLGIVVSGAIVRWGGLGVGLA